MMNRGDNTQNKILGTHKQMAAFSKDGNEHVATFGGEFGKKTSQL